MCISLYNNVHAIIWISHLHKSYTKLHLHGKVAYLITQVSKYVLFLLLCLENRVNARYFPRWQRWTANVRKEIDWYIYKGFGFSLCRCSGVDYIRAVYEYNELNIMTINKLI